MSGERRLGPCPSSRLGFLGLLSLLLPLSVVTGQESGKTPGPAPPRGGSPPARPGSPAPQTELPELGRGWHRPGTYRVRCDYVTTPEDAVAVTLGTTARKPSIGEQGETRETVTTVRRKNEDGRPTGANLVGPAEKGNGCVVRLERAGVYEVEVKTTLTRWVWRKSEAASSASVVRAHTEPLTGKTALKRYTIYVRGDCSEDEVASPPPSPPDPVRDRLRETFVSVLSSRSPGADESSVSIEPLPSGSLWEFAVRLTSDGCVLPSMWAMFECAKPMTGAAPVMLFGALQRVGDRNRVSARLVDTWTGIILTAGKGDSEGEDNAALAEALNKALNALDFSWSCGGVQ